jgi:cytochrome P450
VAEAPDWVQRLVYRIASALFNQPLLLRAVAWLVRGSGGLASATGLVASARGVRDVLARETHFTHGHLPAVMLDGPFLIGLPSGPQHAQKRICLHGLLPTPELMAEATQQAVQLLLPRLQAKLNEQKWFDLVEDYMAPLVWCAIRLAYDPQRTLNRLQAQPSPEPEPMEREWLLAARWLGAQLLIGSIAPPDERQRALRSAALLGAAFAQGQGTTTAGPFTLDDRWAQAVPDKTPRLRDAIGLLWVGHPATVQGGALMMQELLARPQEYQRLRAEMAAADKRGDANGLLVRERLRDHVLELLRFRPPFPLLGRLVPTEASFKVGTDPGAARTTRARPGSVAVMTIGALFDPAAQREDPREYLPGRHFYEPEDRLLMFGTGPRHCVAREQVIEILVSALAGLLQLGDTPLGPQGRRAYDGPVIVEMKLGY